MGINAHITDSGTKLKAEVVHKDDCDCNGLIVATVPLRTFDNALRFFINDDYGADMNQGATSTGTPLPVHNGIDNVGTATATTADKLVDANQGFTDAIYVGMTVYNTTDSTTASVTAIDSDTILSLSADIMASGETYIIGLYWDATNLVGAKMTASSADRAHTGNFSLKVDNPAVDDVYQLTTSPVGDVDMTNYSSMTIWVNVYKDWKAGYQIAIYGWDTGTGLQIGTPVEDSKANCLGIDRLSYPSTSF